MPVVGNDVIVLQHNTSNDNISNPKAQRFFRNDTSRVVLPLQKQLIWWTAKEAAYKCLQKCGLKHAFSPALYRVVVNNMNNNKYYGEVNYKNETLHFLTTCENDMVHTIASNRPINIESLVVYVTSGTQKFSYESFGRYLNQNKNIGFIPVINKTDDNIPFLPVEIKMDISISHSKQTYAFVAIER